MPGRWQETHQHHSSTTVCEEFVNLANSMSKGNNICEGFKLNAEHYAISVLMISLKFLIQNVLSIQSIAN